MPRGAEAVDGELSQLSDQLMNQVVWPDRHRPRLHRPLQVAMQEGHFATVRAHGLRAGRDAQPTEVRAWGGEPTEKRANWNKKKNFFSTPQGVHGRADYRADTRLE